MVAPHSRFFVAPEERKAILQVFFGTFLFLARTQLATTRFTSPRVGILIGTCRIVWCCRFSFNYTPSMQAAPAEIPRDDFTIDR